MPLPNFIVIGAPRSGSTALFQRIAQHPAIFCSKPKEPNFFALMGETADFVEPDGRPRPVGELGITDIESYRALFDSAADAAAIGEASVAYMPDPRVPQRIHRLVPDVKLIAILRNPVDAAFSGYLMTRGHGVEPCETFEAALQDQRRRETGRYFDGLYIQPGFYCAHLQQYRAYFPDARIRVYLFEEFSQDPQAVLSDIFGFLEVDRSFNPGRGARVNLSGVPKSKFLHRLLTGRTNPMARFILPHIPASMRRFLIAIRNRNLRRPTMAAETRQKLIDVFRGDIENLQKYLGRDLSHWLK